jgi:hypothetical protein
MKISDHVFDYLVSVTDDEDIGATRRSTFWGFLLFGVVAILATTGLYFNVAAALTLTHALAWVIGLLWIFVAGVSFLGIVGLWSINDFDKNSRSYDNKIFHEPHVQFRPGFFYRVLNWTARPGYIALSVIAGWTFLLVVQLLALAVMVFCRQQMKGAWRKRLAILESMDPEELGSIRQHSHPFEAMAKAALENFEKS